MSATIRCKHCRRVVLANPRVKEQSYCGKSACQRARKAAWQAQRLSIDPAYQDNQQRGRTRWRRHNPGYWARYRSRHPDYVQRNRQLQRLRDLRRRRRDLAKMDTSEEIFPLKTGTYFLVPQARNLAKMDALAQKVHLIPASYADLAKKDAMDALPRAP